MRTQPAPAAAETVARANAKAVADRLFPEAWPGGVRDVEGRHWLAEFDQMVAALSLMPSPTLTAYARAVEECESSDGDRFDGGLLDAIGSHVLRWIDMTVPGRRDRRQAIGSPTAQIRCIGDAITFSDIILAAADAPDEAQGDDGEWGSWHDALNLLWESLRGWHRACAETGAPVTVPDIGYVGADEFALAGARTAALGDLARRLIAKDTPPVTAETRALLRRHHRDPYRVLAVVAERRTLDADVLTAVLDAEAPAVAEGAL